MDNGTIALGKLTLKIGSGATPRGGKDSYKSEGIALFRSLNVYDLQFDASGLAYIDDEQAAQLANVEVLPGDVLLNITGASVARSALAPSHLLPARVNQHVAILRPDPQVLDGRFLNYTLVSPRQKGRLLAIAQGGATREALTKRALEQFDIPVPPLAVQRKISALLAAYDELIENNLRRIEILEKMAQAVYREWFVNFRFPGHENVGLVDSPLGPIPEGWSAGTFGDLVENQRVNVNPLRFPDEQFDHFSFAAFDEGRLPTTERGETMKSGKLLVDQDSVLLAKLNPRIPRVWFARPGGVRRSVASSEFLVLTPRTGSALELIDATCRDPSFQSQLATMSGGTSTSHQRLKLEDLMRLPIPVPSKDAVEAFVDVARPMYRLVTNLAIQNENLRTTRDLLLPKLVSGEVDVSDMDIDTDWLAS